MNFSAPSANDNVLSATKKSAFISASFFVKLALAILITLVFIGMPSYAMGRLPWNPEPQPPSDFNARGLHSVFIEYSSSCIFYHPKTIGDAVGFVGWGNGTAGPNIFYLDGMRHLASHGLVVAAARTVTAGNGVRMNECMDKAIEKFGEAVDHKIAYSGHSQGGAGAMSACANDSDCLGTVLMAPYIKFIPLGTRFDEDNIARQSGEMLILGGASDLIANRRFHLQPSFDNTNVPATFIYINGVSHFEPLIKFGRYRSATTAFLLSMMDNRPDADAFLESLEDLQGYRVLKN